MSIPCVALTSTIHAYIMPYSQPRGRPLKIRQVSLALCQLSSMASTAAGLDPRWSHRTGHAPCVSTTQAIAPTGCLPKNPRVGGWSGCRDVALFSLPVQTTLSERYTHKTNICERNHYSSPCPQPAFLVYNAQGMEGTTERRMCIQL